MKCDALVVAGYQWKIPDWQASIQYAINFHPSPLPIGRGPYPLTKAILDNYTSWAITCHKISDQFDQGDILDAETYLIDADETHESLKLKTLMSGITLAERIAGHLEFFWATATLQKNGSYWPLWREQDRIVDFTQPIETILCQIRAFGDFECIAIVNDLKIYLHRTKGWVENHSYETGKVVFSSSLALVISVKDGFLAVTEWSFNAPNSVTANLRK